MFPVLISSSLRSLYYWHPYFTDEQIEAEWFPKSHNHDVCRTFLISGPLFVTDGQYGFLTQPI